MIANWSGRFQDRRQRLASGITVTFLVLSATLSGVMIPARMGYPWPVRLAFGMAAFVLGTCLVRLVYGALAWSLRRAVRARRGGSRVEDAGVGAAVSGPWTVTPWLASTLLVTLAAMTFLAFQAVSAFDALDGGPLPALSVTIGVGMAASCLGLASFFAWMLDRRTRRTGMVAGTLGLALTVASAALWLTGWRTDRSALPLAEVSGAIGDPGRAGPYQVEVFGYGPADDPRAGYGAEVRLRTARFDLTTVAPPAGWTKARSARLGFGPEAVPISGRAYVPAGPGPFPLVLIAHGTAAMAIRSELGFEQLGRLLASRGYAVASIDQTFLGFGRAEVGDLGGGDVLARAWLVLTHAEAWARFAETPGGPLRGRVDLGRVALVGHSRGGEAVIGASKLHGDGHGQGRFQVKAVAALAPTANRIPPSLAAAFLTLQGDLDNDVEGFLGLRTFEDVRLPELAGGAPPALKAAVYVEGANHAKFNEQWGVSDQPWPFSLLENRAGALPASAQRRVLNVYLSAFLDAALRGDPHGRALLRDARLIPPLLPGVATTSRFLDSRSRLLADFDAGVDPESTTVPGARVEVAGAAATMVAVPLRLPEAFGSLERTVLELSWSRRTPGDPARLAVSLEAPGLALRDQALTFDLALAVPVPLTVRLRDAQGRWATARLEEFFPIRPARQAHLTRFPAAEIDSHELPFQTVVLAARDLRHTEPGFDPGDIRRVELELGGPDGTILLDDPAVQPL